MVPEKALEKSSGNFKKGFHFGDDYNFRCWCRKRYPAYHMLVSFGGQKNLAERSFGKLGVTKVYNMFLDFMSEVHHLVVTVMLSRG